MKRILTFGLKIALILWAFPSPAIATDQCLSTFSDSEWSSGQSPTVAKFIYENSKDYAGGLSFNEWEYAPDKWFKYNALVPTLNSTVSNRLRSLNSIEAIPFSLGAKNGDRIRSTYIYSGRNCATRTIVVNPSRIYSETNLITYENDYEIFIKTIARSFNEENWYRTSLPKKIELRIDKSQGELLVAGQTRISNIDEFTDAISEDIASNTLFYFPEDCFSISTKTDFHFNWWSSGSPRSFTKPGNCTAQLYFVAEAKNLQKKTMLLYNYGGVIFSVSQSLKNKISGKTTTIICIKGKVTKIAAGVNPKCPTGYKVQR